MRATAGTPDVGWWNERVVPRLTDVLLSGGALDSLRARVCQGLRGVVLEVGFGSGLNVTHYPSAVERVLAVEPSDVAWHLAAERLTSGPPTVVRAGLDGQELALLDRSVDCALSTFTLCTIPDPEAALGEVRRVLRPGGEFNFLEHGLAGDPRVARWQHRLTPLQRRVAAGCHLDRPVADVVAGAGLEIVALDTFYLDERVPGAKAYGHLYLGRAVRR